jgi:hypothetical protein
MPDHIATDHPTSHPCWADTTADLAAASASTSAHCLSGSGAVSIGLSRRNSQLGELDQNWSLCPGLAGPVLRHARGPGPPRARHGRGRAPMRTDTRHFRIAPRKQACAYPPSARSRIVQLSSLGVDGRRARCCGKGGIAPMPRTRSLGTTMSGRIGRCSVRCRNARKERGSRLPPAHAFETDPT